MSWWGMMLTHLGLYLAGVVTTATLAIFYELVIAKHSRTGVYCDECRRRLDDPARRTAQQGVPSHYLTVDAFR